MTRPPPPGPAGGRARLRVPSRDRRPVLAAEAYNTFSVTPEASQYQTSINANVLTPCGYYDPSLGTGGG